MESYLRQRVVKLQLHDAGFHFWQGDLALFRLITDILIYERKIRLEFSSALGCRIFILNVDVLFKLDGPLSAQVDQLDFFVANQGAKCAWIVHLLESPHGSWLSSDFFMIISCRYGDFHFLLNLHFLYNLSFELYII